MKTHSARRSLATATAHLILALVAALALAVPASADSFGELGSFGTVGDGSTPTSFLRPTELGVDPTDDSVYVLDRAADEASYRLQKFTGDGTFVASTSLPRVANESGFFPVYLGVAVDSTLDRIYLLQLRNGADPVSGLRAAEQILVFSTVESGATLVPPADEPDGVLPVPDPAGPSAIDDPRGVAVDPTTHDLLVLGFDQASLDTVATIQRIGTGGTINPDRFVDTAGKLDTPSPNAGLAGLAVGPDGTVYVGKAVDPGRNNIYALPSTLNDVTLVAGTNGGGIASAEGWRNTGGSKAAVAGIGTAGFGSQLAISADGSTLYWTERIADAEIENPGNFLIRGLSLDDTVTRVIYGGNQSVLGNPGPCEITRHGAALAAGSGDSLLVLDPGNYNRSPAPSYGARVVKFGPGGSGCPAPRASFDIGDSPEETVQVQKGATVSFDASDSDLKGATLAEAKWDFGDGSAPLSGTDLTPTHKFIQKGTFDVVLSLTVTGSSLGNPPPVVKHVEVVPGTPIAAFTPSTASPAAGAAVSFDASASIDPTGSAQGGASNVLATYHWDFGDGSPVQETSEPTVEHAFANPATAGLQRTVTLIVTSADDVQSVPLSQQISVQGTAQPGGGGSSGGGSTPPPASGPAPTPPVSTPTPRPRKPSPLARCKKLHGKARAKCVRKARGHGKRKPHRVS